MASLEDRARKFRDKLEGFIVQYNGGTPPQINDGALAVIQRELRDVARKERERCAKAVEALITSHNPCYAEKQCAAAIRSLEDV
jgi:hypothetical protein